MRCVVYAARTARIYALQRISENNLHAHGLDLKWSCR